MIDPITAMDAALEGISESKCAEIELEWRSVSEDRIDQPAVETILTITIRRELKYYGNLKVIPKEQEEGGT